MEERTIHKYDLEERLIEFSVNVLNLADRIPENRYMNIIATQVVRSASSCALNYGEVQSAESANDFIHKMKIILKELRETIISLKILKRKSPGQEIIIEKLLKECNELISIFVKSVQTVQNKQLLKEKQKK